MSEYECRIEETRVKAETKRNERERRDGSGKTRQRKEV
jgi:hypothetical protein